MLHKTTWGQIQNTLINKIIYSNNKSNYNSHTWSMINRRDYAISLHCTWNQTLFKTADVSQYHAMSYKLDFLILFVYAHAKHVGRSAKGDRSLLWEKPSLDNLRIQFNASQKKSAASIQLLWLELCILLAVNKSNYICYDEK